MTIFDKTDAIQANPKWNYDELEHKWTIDENDVIIHSDLSAEIQQDFSRIEHYNLVIEESCEVYNKLTDQLIRNNDILNNYRVKQEDISLNNECLAICGTKLGYDNYKRVSIESDMTNYECLQLSTESIKEILKTLIEKIKNVFKAVWNFFKNLFVKLLKWLGLWEDKLDKMHNDIQPILRNSSNEDYYKDMHKLRVNFNNILNKNPLNIKEETLNKIFNLFPIACLTVYKPNTFQELFESINIKDILRPVTLDLDKTLRLIQEGKFSNLNSSKIMKNVKEYIDKKIKDAKCEVMYITTLNKSLKYLEYNIDKKEISGYKEFEIDPNDFTNPTNYLVNAAAISKDDIENMFKYVQDDFIPKIKYFEKDINKLHIKLDKLINEIDKDIDDENREQLEQNKHNLQLIKQIGVNIPNDINTFMFDITKKYIKMLTLIYDDIKDAGIINLINFVEFSKKTSYPDTEIMYINGNKKMPYIDPGDNFWINIFETQGITCGAAMPSRNSQFDALFGKNTDYTSIVFLDTKALNNNITRANFRSTPKEVYIKLLDDYLKVINIDKHELDYNKYDTFKSELKKYLDNGTIIKVYYEILTDLSFVITYYDDMSISDEHSELKPIKFSNSDKKLLYYHELGHIIMRQNENPNIVKDFASYKEVSDRYLYSTAELQADAYAMIMVGKSIREMAEFRCLKLMKNSLCTKIDIYIQNLKNHINDVKPWVKLNTFGKILNFIKGN